MTPERSCSTVTALTLLVYLLVPVLAIGAQSTAAVENPSASEEQTGALSNLSRLMVTSIQTGTSERSAKLAPGIISVIEKKQLIAAGVDTVSDALTLLPGFDRPQPKFQDDEPILRGIGGIFTGTSGKILYLVNGTSTNNSITAISSLVLQMPVEQIERIEVLRGPGSAVYGENALLGVINIITNQEDEQLYVRAGSFDSYTAGGHFDVQHSANVRSSFDLAYSETGGATLNSGPDILYSFGQQAVSLAPGQPNNAHNLLSGFYDLKGDAWSLSAFVLSENRGDGFGVADALSQPQKFAQTAIQGGVEFSFKQSTGKWAAEYQVAAKKFQREYEDLMIFPPGAFGIYSNGQVGSTQEGERRYEGSVDFSRGFDRHRLNLGLGLRRSEADNIYLEANFLTGVSPPLPLPVMTEQPLGLEGRTRDVASVYISDQFNINPRLELVSGLRIDHYSDIDDPTLASPRFAGSYKMSEQNLFKFQLARAFRAPSFSELYYLLGAGPEGPAGNTDLDSETIDTLELTHDYSLPNTTMRTTLFASQISDLIRLDKNMRFGNDLDAQVQGAEFEFKHQPQPDFSWFGNVSYVDATDKQSDEPLEGSTNWLANAGVTWQPSGRYSTTLRYRYVGERIRSQQDTREDLDAYNMWNISGYVHDFLSAGLALRLGINNLLDEDIRNPSPQPGYANDYPGEGREYWVQLTKAL